MTTKASESEWKRRDFPPAPESPRRGGPRPGLPGRTEALPGCRPPTPNRARGRPPRRSTSRLAPPQPPRRLVAVRSARSGAPRVAAAAPSAGPGGAHAQTRRGPPLCRRSPRRATGPGGGEWESVATMTGRPYSDARPAQGWSLQWAPDLSSALLPTRAMWPAHASCQCARVRVNPPHEARAAQPGGAGGGGGGPARGAGVGGPGGSAWGGIMRIGNGGSRGASSLSRVFSIRPGPPAQPADPLRSSR